MRNLFYYRSKETIQKSGRWQAPLAFKICERVLGANPEGRCRCFWPVRELKQQDLLLLILRVVNVI